MGYIDGFLLPVPNRQRYGANTVRWNTGIQDHGGCVRVA